MTIFSQPRPTEMLGKVEEAVGANDVRELHEKLKKMQVNGSPTICTSISLGIPYTG